MASTRQSAFLLDAAQALDAHLRSTTYGALPPERAFIHWFVEARYGASQKQRYISDGKADGGCDALIRHGDRWVVLQAKYQLSPALGRLGGAAVEDFSSVAQLVRFGREGAVQDWLAGVQRQHGRWYREVIQAAKRDPNSVDFVLITNRLGVDRSNSKIVVEGIEKISELWRLYELELSPPAEELTIHWQQSPLFSEEPGMSSWVGFVEVGDFVKAMRRDLAERLFAENVRTYLRSAVNHQIAHTYQTEPERFWLGNNGLYVVCRHSRQDGLRHHLNYASIINGSQTLHAVAQAAKQPRSCKILVRVLELDGQRNPDLLNSIIKRTNSQNAMKLVNLFAHDLPQVSIARYLQRYRVFYERREREWQNEKKGQLDGWLHVPTLAVIQWLSVVMGVASVGLARAQPAKLFEEDRYEPLMRKRFTGDLNQKSYEQLAIVVWCGLLVSHLPKKFPRKGAGREKRRAAKIASLLLVRLLYETVNSSKALRTAVLQKLLPEQRVGKQVPARIVSVVGHLLSDILRLQRVQENLDERLDLSNFFKRGEMTDLAERKVFTKARQRQLKRALESGWQKIT